MSDIVKRDLDTISIPPDQMIDQGSEKAKALMKVITQVPTLITKIGKGSHLKFEGWQTCGQFFSATPRTYDAVPVTLDGIQGFKARAEVVKNGTVIGGAEAYCMRDEDNWGSKPSFQLASMAQTRAAAKALRQCFSWIVVLAGYDPTPAEEMISEKESHRREPVSPMTEAEQAEWDTLPFDQPEEPKAPAKSDDKVSEAQAKRLFAIAKRSGFSNDQIKEICGAAGYNHSKDIRKRHYEKLVESFEIGTPEQTSTIAGFISKWVKEN